MTVTPELETSEGQGSRIRGILGAFLGALLGAFAWYLLMFAVDQENEFWEFTYLAGVIVGPMSGWGYRLFRGLREVKFARWTVRICALLAQIPALVLALTLVRIYHSYGTLKIHADTLVISLSRSLGLLGQKDTLVMLGSCMFAVFFFSRLALPGLLKYADPEGISLPQPPIIQASEFLDIPWQFTVREGKLCLVIGWIGTVLFGALALACLIFLEGWEKLLYALLALPLLVLSASLLLSRYNRRLEVNGEQITYTTIFGRVTRFTAADAAAGSMRLRRLLGVWELLDRGGKLLARFEPNMENFDLLMAYLNRYLESKEQNRKE